MNKELLYNSIMKELSKVVKKHLDEALGIINVNEMKDFCERCKKYSIEQGLLERLYESPLVDFEEIYLRDRGPLYKQTYESYEDDLNKYNIEHSNTIKNVEDYLRAKYGLMMKDYRNNIEVIINEMNAAGYVLIHKDISKNVATKYCTAAWLTFSPVEEFPLNNYMFDNMNKPGFKYLYHITSNDKLTRMLISLDGIEPSSSSVGYLYKDKAFFKYGTSCTEKYFNMMKERYPFKDSDGNIIKDIYRVRITKDLLDNYKFYKDGNADECCYTKTTVKNKFIEPRESVNLNTEHPELKE